MSTNSSNFELFIATEMTSTSYTRKYSDTAKQIWIRPRSDGAKGKILVTKKIQSDQWITAYNNDEIGNIYIELNQESTLTKGKILVTKKIQSEQWITAYNNDEIGNIYLEFSSSIVKADIYISKMIGNYKRISSETGTDVKRLFCKTKIQTQLPPCPEGQHRDASGNCVPDPQIERVKFAAVGDTNCTDNAKKIFAVIKAANVDFFLALGDFSYGSSQKCWIELCRGLGDKLFPNNIFPMIGNHDDEEDGTKEHREDIINAFPHMTSNGWYTVTKGNIRIIIMDTQKDYTEGAQHTFAVNALKAAANDPAIKWIIVCYHKPSIATADGDHDGLADFREIYHPLFDQYKVDLVFAGHRHSYTRTKPVNYKTTPPFYTVKVDSNGPYTNPGGTIFITAGAGGRNIKPNNSNEPFVAKADGSNFGVSICELSNQGKTMTCKYLSNNNGQEIESVVINKT